MIRPDANVLVDAFQASEPAHAPYRTWLTDAVNGVEPLALTDATAIGFLRIVTNRRMYARPATTSAATAFVDAIAQAPSARWIGATAATWARFAEIVADDPRVRANLVPDAWIAALAMSHGARVASADRGLARYRGLDWFDPVR